MPVSSSQPAIPTPSSLEHPGLANLGNTCFLSSIIQAINASKPFKQILIDNLHSIQNDHPLCSARALNQYPSDKTPVIDELANVLVHLNSKSGTLRPVALLQALGARHREYLRKDQQDAHEFLHVLLQLIRAEEAVFLAHLQNHPSVDPLDSAQSDASAKPSPKLEPIAATNFISSSSSASSARSFPLPTSTFSAASSASSSSSIEPPTQSPKQPVPYLDSLLAGCLTQYTVCENLHVSTLAEEFLDLSIPTRDLSRNAGLGKRARFRKHIQNRLKGTSTAKLHLSLQPAPVSPLLQKEADVLPRRSSLSNSDRPPLSAMQRRASLDSCRDVNFCSPRIAFWATSALPATTPTTEPSPLKMRFGSKASLRLGRPTKDTPTSPAVQSPGVPTHTEAHKTYVRSILAETPKLGGSQNPLHPLRFSLPSPSSQAPLPSPSGAGPSRPSDSLDTGLHSLLRKFTGIDVLEGDNKFACKECWKGTSGVSEERQRRSSKPMPLARTPTSLFRQSSPSSTRSATSSQPGSLLASPVVVRGDIGPISPAFTPSSPGDESWEEIPTIRISTKQNGEFGEVGSEARWLGSSSGQEACMPEGSASRGRPGSSLGLDCGSSAGGLSPTVSSGRADPEDSSSEASGFAQPLEVVPAPQQQAFAERLRATLRRSTPATHSTSKQRVEQQPVMCRAFKRYLFAQLPEVLVVHLQRFEPVWKSSGGGVFGTGVTKKSGSEWNKVEDIITFPERLDMTPFSVPDLQSCGEDNVYGLVSVVVHKGQQVGGGHYVAYVLSERGNGAQGGERQWVYCSDSETRSVEKSEVFRCQAYMLIYEKAGRDRSS